MVRVNEMDFIVYGIFRDKDYFYASFLVLKANRTKALSVMVSFCKGEWMLGIKKAACKNSGKECYISLRSSFKENGVRGAAPGDPEQPVVP
jgi:hypothetical protein